MLEDYSRYTSKKARERGIQADLGVAFKDLYKLKHAEQDIIGCINIYSPENTCLFISACCDYKVNRTLCIKTLLERQNKTDDYVYYLIQLCNMIPKYAWKMKAVAIFRQHLEKAHLPYSSRYVLKVNATYCKKSLKNRCMVV